MGKHIAARPTSPGQGRDLPWQGLAYLSAVYVIWGSTYLAIRVAVRPGSGFPPFTMGATRILLAGALIFGLSALRRYRLRVTGRELGLLAASGLLLWTGGNGLVVWAEQRANSGYAALIISTVPIWIALIEAIIDRRWPSRQMVAALLVGFIGIIVLTAPELRGANQADLLALAALLLSPLSWSLGSILQQRRPVAQPVLVTSAYQHLFGGLGFAIAMLLTHEPRPSPSPEAWLAWLYLVTVGSLIGFTSFLQALRLLPISIATTYAYVNPVVAVGLGALILHEPITSWMVAGSLLVLVGVAGIFRLKYRRQHSQTATRVNYVK